MCITAHFVHTELTLEAVGFQDLYILVSLAKEIPRYRKEGGQISKNGTCVCAQLLRKSDLNTKETSTILGLLLAVFSWGFFPD